MVASWTTQVWWSIISWPALRLQIFMKVWKLQSLPMICVRQSLQTSPRFWGWSQEFWNDGVGWTWKPRKTTLLKLSTPKMRNPSQPRSPLRCRPSLRCQKCRKYPRCSTWYWSHNRSPRGSLKQWNKMKWRLKRNVLNVFFVLSSLWLHTLEETHTVLPSHQDPSRSQRNCHWKDTSLCRFAPWQLHATDPGNRCLQSCHGDRGTYRLWKIDWSHGCRGKELGLSWEVATTLDVCEFPPVFSMVDTPLWFFHIISIKFLKLPFNEGSGNRWIDVPRF